VAKSQKCFSLRNTDRTLALGWSDAGLCVWSVLVKQSSRPVKLRRDQMHRGRIRSWMTYGDISSWVSRGIERLIERCGASGQHRLDMSGRLFLVLEPPCTRSDATWWRVRSFLIATDWLSDRWNPTNDIWTGTRGSHPDAWTVVIGRWGCVRSIQPARLVRSSSTPSCS
jgi:hypothetical protein